MPEPGADPSSGISSGDALIPPERHPACRRREARLGSCMERENLTGDVKGKGARLLSPDNIPRAMGIGPPADKWVFLPPFRVVSLSAGTSREGATHSPILAATSVEPDSGRAPSLVFYVFWCRNRLSASNQLVPACKWLQPRGRKYRCAGEGRTAS